MTALMTDRLELVPISLPMVEAVMAGDRAGAEAAARARLPEAWPGPALIERAFSSSLERIRQDPKTRLWGDRLMITRTGPRVVVGSVIFHGAPDDTGTVEVGYGVEAASQGRGFATEATTACVRWALSQPRVERVTATTFPWHVASVRVIEKLGMVAVDSVIHETLGDMIVYELRLAARRADPVSLSP